MQTLDKGGFNMELEITTENFDELVLNSDKTVLVDFWTGVVHVIASIPTVIVFKNGEITNKSIGLVSKAELLSLLD